MLRGMNAGAAKTTDHRLGEVHHPQVEEVAMGLKANDGLSDGGKQKQSPHDLVYALQMLACHRSR